MEAPEKLLQVMQTAVQMEIDGKAFYLKAAEMSGNALGVKLFTQLAAEEDIHRRAFENIAHATQAKQGWGEVAFNADQAVELKTVFAAAAEELGTAVKVAQTELDAVQTAIGMENKSYDLYKEAGQTAASAAEKELLERLAAEESGHRSTLTDYFEYLSDPSSYFQNKEHHSMDGA